MTPRDEPPTTEQGELPEHAVPADLVELHQLIELNDAAVER